MLSETAIKALIRIAQDRLPDDNAFDNFKNALLSGKITTSDPDLIDAVANLSSWGAGPDEDLAAGFDALPDEAYTLGSDAHNFICRFIDRWELHHCTILGRITGRVSNLNFLDEFAKKSMGNYIAKLILDSSNIYERYKRPWTYKSVADYGEEMFVRSGSIYEIVSSFKEFSGRHWKLEAEKELSESLSYVITQVSADEGLDLYAQNSSGEFERITNEDPDYSYIVRLMDETGAGALNFFDGPPGWAKRLHLYCPNWKAHKLMLGNCPASDSLYQQWKAAHRRAVLLETREQERKAVSPDATADETCEHIYIEKSTLQTEIDRIKYENARLRTELEQARAEVARLQANLEQAQVSQSMAIVPEYLNPTHPRYSYRMAAAVQVWEAITETGKKGVKKAIEEWLLDHAKELGLIYQGKPSDKAIKEVATVANWNTAGGAPKTC